MNPLRQFLLVAVLLFAQLAAGAHAVEHTAGKDGVLPTHACELCLATHNLGSALPSLAALPRWWPLPSYRKRWTAIRAAPFLRPPPASAVRRLPENVLI
ncbi:hypothetical protein [Dechloromonas sp. A34]|uniref:hypothetical protein n=1 Tax=Dechloromonas sp. A34 TaxID=447588 RepID=UPI0022492A4D|nr:hypothetical protein [Dechloromonas sp. A34]